jgi:hypothetical protein
VGFSFKLPRLIYQEDYVSLRHFETFKPVAQRPYLMPYCFNAPCQFKKLLDSPPFNFGSNAFGCFVGTYVILYSSRNVIFGLRLFLLRPTFSGMELRLRTKTGSLVLTFEKFFANFVSFGIPNL